jgi:hypothetical protein
VGQQHDTKILDRGYLNISWDTFSPSVPSVFLSSHFSFLLVNGLATGFCTTIGRLWLRIFFYRESAFTHLLRVISHDLAAGFAQ